MSNLFTINKQDLIKAGIKFILVILGAVATYFESYIPGLLQVMTTNQLVLAVLLAINTSLVDLIRKFITDEEGKLGGVTLVIK